MHLATQDGADKKLFRNWRHHVFIINCIVFFDSTDRQPGLNGSRGSIVPRRDRNPLGRLGFEPTSIPGPTRSLPSPSARERYPDGHVCKAEHRSRRERATH
jgi:hypothetical protein